MKKIITRKCIVTNKVYPRDNLLRVSKSKDGTINVDPSYLAPGRGAYILKSKEVILKAKDKNILAKVFKCQIDLSIYDLLLKEVD